MATSLQRTGTCASERSNGDRIGLIFGFNAPVKKRLRPCRAEDMEIRGEASA